MISSSISVPQAVSRARSVSVYPAHVPRPAARRETTEGNLGTFMMMGRVSLSLHHGPSSTIIHSSTLRSLRVNGGGVEEWGVSGKESSERLWSSLILTAGTVR